MRKAFETSPQDDILTEVSSYFPNDGSDLVHFHENAFLSFVIKGGGTIKSKSLMCERLPGNLIFSYAGEPHQCIAKQFPTVNVNIELGLDLLRANCLTEASLENSIRKNPNAKPLMLKIYKEILCNDDCSSSSIKILLFDLISNARVSDIEQPVWVGRIYEFMNDRWSESLTLEDLAQTAGVHPVTISKYFRKYFGCTFGEYIRRIRIERSLSIIKNSSLSLTEIGYECGFYDQSHFSRTFQQLTGFSPKSYAKL
jgi:AraC family transcriptional regulator